MPNIIFWLIFGFLISWIAAIMMNTNSSGSTIRLIAGGVVGALFGGFCMHFLMGGTELNTYDPTSIMGAAIGAVAAIGLLQVITSEPTPH